MAISIKQYIRPILPTSAKQIYHLFRDIRSMVPSRRKRLTLVTISLLHRLRKRPEPVAVLPDKELGPIYIRPFSSDLRMLGSLIGKDGEYEPVRRLLADAHTIIDLGSNIGFTLRLWSRWFPAARVVAVEPDVGNFEIAQRNIEPADQSRITLLNAAVSDQPGTLYLDCSGQSWAFKTMRAPAAQTVAVQAFTMPQLLALLGESPLDLLKCDIEGSEQPLFKSCREWISSVRMIIVETHRPYTLEEMQSDLTNAGSVLTLVYVSTNYSEHAIGIFKLP